MRRTGQSVQIVIAKVLDAPAIREAVSIADAVVGVGRLVDRGPTGAELMENVRHLRRGIIPEALCKSIVG